MDKKKLLEKIKPLLKAALPAAGKKAGSEAIKATTGVGIPAQQAILDIVQLGIDADRKITRRQFLVKLGNKLKARQPGNVAKGGKGYLETMDKLGKKGLGGFAYMSKLVNFYMDYR